MALHTRLPAYVPTPYIFLLPVPHRILSCSENLVVATGKGLIKAVALSDTFLPQEPPQRKHIVGAMPAVLYCCCWLANEGNVAVREYRKNSAANPNPALWIWPNQPHRHVFHASANVPTAQ